MSRSPPAVSARAPIDVSAEGCAADVLEVMPAVMDAMRSAMRHQVGEQLSVPQFRCLNFITQRPGSSVSAVAAFLGVTVPTASAMVDRLVRAGSVQPTTAAADRRRSELHVTPAGREQIEHMRSGARVEFARALAACTPAELHALHQGMAVLRRTFQNP